MSNEPSEQYNIDFNINHDPDPIANEKHNVPFVEDDEQIGGFKIGFNKLNEGVAKLLERVKFLEYDKDKNALIVKGNLYTTGAMNSILNFSNFYIDIALKLLNAMEKQLEEDVEDNLTNEEESINENNLTNEEDNFENNLNEEEDNNDEDKKDLILINDDEFKEKPFYEIYFIKTMEKLGMKNVFIYSDCLNNGKVLYLYFDSDNYIVFRYLNNKITYRLNTDDINSWKDLYEIDLSNYFSKDDRDIRLDKIRYKNYLWKSDRVITLGNNEKITIGIENEEPYFKLDDFGNIECNKINGISISELTKELSNKANIEHKHDWNSIENIPEEFNPSEHNHDNIYLKNNSDINVNTINGHKIINDFAGSNGVPILATIKKDSVMEVGKYIDFHDTNNYSGDFNVRLHATGNTLEFNKLDGKADINCGNINGVLNCNSTSTHQLGNINIDHASSTAINFHGNANEWRFRINHASWGSNVYRWINFGGWGHGISIIGDNNDAPDGTNTYINITKDGKIEGDNFMKQMIDLIYPVGIVIYLGNTTNPNDLYSGTTWVKLSSGYYIQTCADNPLDTGGSSTTGEHTLTIDEMPKHSHGLSCLNIRGNEDGSDQYTYAQSGGYAAGKSTNETGGGKAHSHTINPPYIQLIAWRRIETINIPV